MKEELAQLETFIGEIDFLLQEGVVITSAQQTRFAFLFERGLSLIDDFQVNDIAEGY